MSIAPLVKSVTVKAPPARAFDLFVTRIDRWWPRKKTIGSQPLVAVVIEPRDGGRWYERDVDGHETQWGKVLSFEPPHRLVLGWQIGPSFTYDPGLVTEVEITVTATADGGTAVRLEHRDLERFGAAAAKMAENLGMGWPDCLAHFAADANALV